MSPMMKDLSVAEQLDSARMSEVQGGKMKEELAVPRETQPYGPGGVNQPVLWNNGIDGPIIIWDRDGTNP
jgi:hypothetical protein